MGKKRHIVVDVMGNLLSVVVHTANTPDTKGGMWVAARAFDSYPTIKKFCGDEGYCGIFVDFPRIMKFLLLLRRLLL